MKTRQKIRFGITFGSFLLFPVIVNYLSPVLILGGASEGIVNGSMMLFGLLLISSLFLGRIWCGWMCPASGMQDACRSFRQKKAKTGWGNTLRIFLWLAWAGLIAYLFVKAGGINSINILYNTDQVISILDPIIVFVYLGVVLLVFLMVLVFGQRAFCKYLCWMAPFMMIGDRIRNWLRIPGIYLVSDKDQCIKCGKCTRECPMDIDVQALIQKGSIYDSECLVCLNCVDVCPKGAICLGARPSQRKEGK